MERSKKTAGKNVAAETVKSAATEVKPAAKKAAKETKAAARTVVEETKKVAKKATTKRRKKDMKVNAYVEYYGKQVQEDTMIADVKKAWTKSGHKIGEIKTMDLYIKPEESKVYYVINGTESGSVEF